MKPRDHSGQLICTGVRDNLDGVFGIAPAWISRIVEAAEADNWHLAARLRIRSIHL